MKYMVESKTKDVRLFAAIASMGMPWEQDTTAVDGGERVWLFGELSDCGKWKLSELLVAWRDSTFNNNHPDHPFSIVKTAMACGIGLKRYINNGGGITQRKSGKGFIIEHTDDARNQPPSPRASDCAEFISALSAVGFDVWSEGYTSGRRFFGCSPRSSTYGYEYGQARSWWIDKTFESKNGQHPFAYAKSAVLNYKAAVEAIVRDRPLVRWQPPGSIGVAHIHPNCSSETESIVSKWLKGIRK